MHYILYYIPSLEAHKDMSIAKLVEDYERRLPEIMARQQGSHIAAKSPPIHKWNDEYEYPYEKALKNCSQCNGTGMRDYYEPGVKGKLMTTPCQCYQYAADSKVKESNRVFDRKTTCP